jgi:hypothetical protein
MFYLPLLVVMTLWRRVREVPRLPPERLTEAISSGIRYVRHSPPIRTVLIRTVTVGFSGGVVFALLPLVARDILHGDARVYGFMLGMFGGGSVLGALGISAGRNRPTPESAVRTNTLVLAAAVILVGSSRWLPLTGFALIVAGTSWLPLANIFNVSIQMSAPRWVAGRALAMYQAAISGGVAIGSWVWGLLAGMSDVSVTMLCKSRSRSRCEAAPSSSWLSIASSRRRRATSTQQSGSCSAPAAAMVRALGRLRATSTIPGSGPSSSSAPRGSNSCVNAIGQLWWSRSCSKRSRPSTREAGQRASAACSAGRSARYA